MSELSREQVAHCCKNVNEIGHLSWEARELLDTDAALRARVAELAHAKIDELHATVERLTAEEQLANKQVCRWTETKDGSWETGCGNCYCFEDGGPSDNRMQFCGYCGKGLVEDVAVDQEAPHGTDAE